MSESRQPDALDARKYFKLHNSAKQVHSPLLKTPLRSHDESSEVKTSFALKFDS
jgi:hypothetical protein